MKIKILLASFIILFVVNNTLSQTYYMWTPNEKGVITSNISEHQPSTDEYNIFQEQLNNYNVVMLTDCDTTKGTYNCHFYAWHNNQGHEVWSSTPPAANNYWKSGEPNLLWLDMTPSKDFYSDASYSSTGNHESWISTTDNDAAIISYKYNNGDPAHSARLLTNGECISKWAMGGLVRHSPDNCPWGDTAEYTRVKYKLNPSYREVRTDHQPMFSKIDEAVNNAPSGCLIYVDNYTFDNVDNITVQSDQKLKIASGSVLKFDPGKKLKVNGEIEAYNVTFRGQSATAGYNYWQGIEVHDDAVIENCTIKSAYAGVRTISSTEVTIEDNEFRTCENGIYCTNDGYNLLILGNSFYNMNSNAVWVVSSQAKINSNDVDYTLGDGIKIASVSSSIYDKDGNTIDSADGDGILLLSGNFSTVKNSTIQGCDDCCVYADATSTPDVCPNNYIKRDGNWSVYNANTSHWIDAYSNTWVSMLNYGNINLNPPKPTAFVFDEWQLFERGKTQFESKNYNRALNTFKLLIENFYDSKFSFESLKYIMKIFNKTGKNYTENVTYFENIKNVITNKGIQNKMTDFLDLFILQCLHKGEVYTEIESKYNELLAKFNNDTYLNELKFRLSIFYIYNMKTPDKAVPYLIDLSKKDTPFSKYAKDELKFLNIDPDSREFAKLSKSELAAIVNNYPNPFNPVTTIRYLIKEPGTVKITIFNVLGQKIKTVINDYKPAGMYEIKWDGTNSYGEKAASGIYFYRLSLNNKTIGTKKMFLMK